MEGLIPFIYKAIKERKTRSYSRCSSTGSARGFGAGGVEDGDVWEQKRWKDDGAGRDHMTHRRHRSLEELAGEVGAGEMRRGKSSRIFSCIGGM
ncbi:unnamed protein product [Alopecurus aequalis]